MADRSKYKTASSEEMQSEEQRINALTNQGRGNSRNYLSIKPGFNTLRIFPPQLTSSTTIAFQAKTGNWFQIEVWLKKGKEDKLIEVYNPTDEDIKKGDVFRGMKKKFIFNSKVHGDTAKDLAEEYIKFTKAYYAETIEDKEELKKKLEPLTHFQKGIPTQTSYVCYVRRDGVDGSKEYGYLEITKGVKDQINALSARESASGPIMVDVFSHPDSGKAIQINYNKNETDNKKKYQVTLLWEKDWTLSDEELDNWEKLDSLETLFKGAFKRSDFEKQVEGISRYDKESGFKTFEHDDFLKIVDEISEYFPEEEVAEESADLPFGGGEEKTEVKTAPVAKVETSSSSVLDTLSKDILLEFIKENDLSIEVKALHNASKVATMIKDVFKAEGMEAEMEGIVQEFLATKAPQQEIKEEKATSEVSSKVDSLKSKYAKKNG